MGEGREREGFDGVEGLGAFGGVGPGAGEGLRGTVGGVGDGCGLVEIGRKGGELGRDVCVGGDAAMQRRPVRVFVERGGRRGDVAGLLVGLLVLGLADGVGAAEDGWGVAYVVDCGDGGRGCGSLSAGGCGCFGGGEEVAEADPGAVGIVAGAGGEVVGGLKFEGLAGMLDRVEGAGLERKGNGPGKVDARVFKMAVDKERDGDEARCGGMGEVASPLIDGEGTGDRGGGFDGVGLCVQSGEQERVEEERAAENEARMHACEFTSERSDASRGRGCARNVGGFARAGGIVTR